MQHVASEHHAARSAAAVFDQSSFAKFFVEGPDAEAELQRLCANDVSKPVGSIIYTQMLNKRGGIEADVTVSRLGEQKYYIVTGTGFGVHDGAHLRRNISRAAQVSLQEVTSAFACFSVMGPAAREILQPLAEADLGNGAFPFATCQEIFIAGAPVIASRVTFVGELGWELHVPAEYALTVYEAVMASGASHGIKNAGYRAIDSLRLEKAYRVWSVDIGSDYTPYEAGLGFAVRLNKPVDFIGRTALIEAKKAPLTKRLVTFSVDPSVVLLGRETIYRDGERIGYLTSGGLGHTVGRGHRPWISAQRWRPRRQRASLRQQLRTRSQDTPRPRGPASRTALRRNGGTRARLMARPPALDREARQRAGKFELKGR